MKRLFLFLLVATGSVISKPATAQVSVNINIGSQPTWGPVGYDYVEYYYLPDIGAYYYVPTRQFIYLNGSNWVYANSLPSRYRTYNLYSGYKVVINEPRPYLKHSTYKVRYAKYKGVKGNQGNNRNNSKYKTYKSRGNGKGHGHN